jgi:two-component system, OmpR family, sensor histidine kinase KdpD
MPRRATGIGDRRRFVRSALVVMTCAGIPTLLAAVPGGISTASAAVVYVLAVTAASAVAGLLAGLAASVLSFLALNFFFTQPFRTLSVAKLDDLVALGVFLVVSVIVGTLLSSAVTQRARAEQREREALLLHRLGTRLLSGEPVDEVLGRFADAVTDLLGLAACEIRTELASEPIRSRAAGRETDPEIVPMLAKGREAGQILLFPRQPGRSLDDEERTVVQTIASQMGLALDGMRQGLEAAEARLEAETNRLRAALFSSVTHDLRTPLASITASVTSLLDGEASFSEEEGRDLLQTIRQEAQRLNRLVGNLLDLARIRAGALVPARAPGSVEEVIEGVLARLQPVLAGHPVRLLVRNDLPQVRMDVVQIDQVLTNLLENAAKFSPSGAPITVAAARWLNSVEVRVVDRGAGIPEGERERVFGLFVKGDGNPAGGTGLGLSIGRAIVEAHGGKIWIEGSPGGGTTIVFGLPVDR